MWGVVQGECLKCVVSCSCRQLNYWLITGASVSGVALSVGLSTAQTLTWQDSNAIFPVGLVRTWFSFFFFFHFLNHIYMYFGEGDNAEDNEFSQKCYKGFFWFPCFVIGAVSVVRRSLGSILKAPRKRKRKPSNPVSCYNFFPRKSYLICSPLGAAFSFKVFWVSDVRLSFSPSVKESVYSAQAPF